MLLINVCKAEFLSYFSSFMAFHWDSELHLEGPNRANMGHGCVPQPAGHGEEILGSPASGRLTKWDL